MSDTPRPPWPTVVCQGELLIDLVATGGDGTIDGATSYLKAAGGAPANVATGLARLGTSVGFVGKVSNDAFGRFLRLTLAREGVDIRGLVEDPAARTPLAFVGSDGLGGRSFIFYHRGMADTILRPDELDSELIANATIFHFGSVSLAAEPGRTATMAAVRIARDAGAIVSFDPNVRLELWDDTDQARDAILAATPLADIIKVSVDEIELVCGTADPARACQRLLEAGTTLAIVTLGSEGACVAANGWDVRVPGHQVTAVDTTGAGDAFVAGVLSAVSDLASADPALSVDAIEPRVLVDAVRFGNAAGALATTAFGAIPSLPSRAAVAALARGGSSRSENLRRRALPCQAR